jgi:uncharacterized membrane protein YqjE
MAPGEGGKRQHASGLLASLPRLLDTLIELAQTRIAIVSTEIEEERERLRELVLYGIWSLFLMGMGLMLGTLFIIVVFWEEYRVHVLGVTAGLYLVAGVIATVQLRRCLRNRPRMFSSTLRELEKDRAELGPKP